MSLLLLFFVLNFFSLNKEGLINNIQPSTNIMGLPINPNQIVINDLNTNLIEISDNNLDNMSQLIPQNSNNVNLMNNETILQQNRDMFANFEKNMRERGNLNNRDSVGLNEVPISEIEKLTRMMEEKNNYIAAINGNGLQGDMNKLNLNLFATYSDLSNNMFSDDDATKKLDDTSGNMISQILNYIKSVDKKLDHTKLKCVADYKTQLGGSLCCGQNGVLTGTQYVCPKEIPYCNSMKCGSKYGECSTVKDAI